MRFLDFPDWLGQLSLAIDSGWFGGALLLLSFAHVYLIVVIARRNTASRFIRAAICVALFELPATTVLLVYVAGLPKA